MNTTPDDELLALWVEDELDPGTAAEVERWAAARPEWLDRRDLARRSREVLASALAPDEPVPHGEFFDARIRRETRLTAAPSGTRRNPGARPTGVARRWIVPLAAAASLALGFWLGHGAPANASDPATSKSDALLYTPESGVEARLLEADDATVILLAGVPALPDSWAIPETAALDPDRRAMAATRSR